MLKILKETALVFKTFKIGNECYVIQVVENNNGIFLYEKFGVVGNKNIIKNVWLYYDKSDEEVKMCIRKYYYILSKKKTQGYIECSLEDIMYADSH